MNKILLGLFKRLICFPFGLILCFIAFAGMPFFFIPHGIYWLITGRWILDDAEALLNYSTT